MEKELYYIEISLFRTIYIIFYIIIRRDCHYIRESIYSNFLNTFNLRHIYVP